jgi:hypothetical protein
VIRTDINLLCGTTDSEMAGCARFDHVLKGHKRSLSVEKPAGTFLSRASSFSPEAVNKFLTLSRPSITKLRVGEIVYLM